MSYGEKEKRKKSIFSEELYSGGAKMIWVSPKRESHSPRSIANVYIYRMYISYSAPALLNAVEKCMKQQGVQKKKSYFYLIKLSCLTQWTLGSVQWLTGTVLVTVHIKWVLVPFKYCGQHVMLQQTDSIPCFPLLALLFHNNIIKCY